MNVTATATPSPLWTLPAWQRRALTAQAVLLVAAAWLLPSVAHFTGLPVGTLLPMHWPVLLAGLCYGWRGGALVGAGAPIVSFLLSGMPPPFLLPSMTVELAAYGCLAGFVREVLHRGRLESAAAALVGGRILFVGMVLATGVSVDPIAEYVRGALMPGLPAAIAQALLLPPLAGWWVRRQLPRA